MKKLLCVLSVLVLLLSGCREPQKLPPLSADLQGYGEYAVYTFKISERRLSGLPNNNWTFRYTYEGNTIENGYRFLYPLELFSFGFITVEIVDKDNPENVFTADLVVGICDGGVGQFEVTVTDTKGREVTYRISCKVVR